MIGTGAGTGALGSAGAPGVAVAGGTLPVVGASPRRARCLAFLASRCFCRASRAALISSCSSFSFSLRA